MELRFEQLTGKVRVKVFDAKGMAIDEFEADNHLETKTLQYHLNTKATGIYFFVATAREGTWARKVVVMD